MTIPAPSRASPDPASPCAEPRRRLRPPLRHSRPARAAALP
ncbi:hypothetical protein [Micrococcus sp.]|nr:hypothetical protein [Micrococcus sp.]MDY6055110.1 hypothetical protein [Micrococcus sp.]